MNRETERVARQLASEIRHRRIGLANEDLTAAGIIHRSYARSKKLRDEDRARLNGMVLALTYVLGKPSDMQAAEALIADAP